MVRPVLALCAGPIARGSIRSVAIRVAGLGLSFGLAVLAARVLGVEGYGIASVAIALAQVGATVALFGLGPLASREFARMRGSGQGGDGVVFAAASMRWVMGAALAGCAIFALAAASGLIPETYSGAIFVGGAAILPLALLQLQRGVAQGQGHIVLAQVPGELLRPAICAVLLGIAFAWGLALDAQEYLVIFAGAAMMTAACALASTLRGPLAIDLTLLATARLGPARTAALPFLGIAVTGVLLGESATLLLGTLSNPREAGLFQPVARLVPLMILPGQVIAVAYAPRIAELWARGERGQVQKVTHTFTLVTAALTLVAVLLLLVAAPPMLLLFGRDFLPGAAMLWILAGAQLVNVAVGPVGHLLTMTGHASVALRGQVTGLATNILVGCVLVPSYGAPGAAIAVASGLTVWNLILLIAARRLTGFDPSIVGAIGRSLGRRK